ncbi:MAG: hypothetical protein J6X49_15355 [Victivallales bacterium]|nr:hypothetical protein [Victivallales bacterium]
MLLFLIVSAFIAIACLSLAAVFFKLSSGDLTDKAPKWPRRPIAPGLVIGTISLVWSAYYGCLMLEGNLAKLHPVVWALVPITAITSAFFLDYLNARAFGGFFTLSANFLIIQAFIHDVPCRPIFSILCLILGLFGMVALSLPWRIRDLFEIAGKNATCAKALAVASAIFGLLILLMPLFARK